MKCRILLFVLPCAVFLLLPLFSPSPEAGETWTLFSTRQRGDMLFYDPSSVIQLPGHRVRVNIKEMQGDGTVIKRVQELNCSERVVRDLEPLAGEGRRAPLSSDFPSPWRGFERDDTRDFYSGLCTGIPQRPR